MIDSSIYQNIKAPPVESQLNNLANVLKLQEMQGSGQLNALKLQEAQRGIDKSNRLESLFSGMTGTEKPDDIANRLMRGGFLKESGDYQKSIRENQKNEAAAAKDMADVVIKRTQSFRDFLPNVKTPKDAIGWVKAQYNDKYLAPIFSSLGSFEEVASKIPQDPEGFNTWVQQQALNMGKFIELNKPSYQTENLGNISQTTARPGLGGAPTIISSKPIGQSPDSVASNARMVEEGRLNRGVTMRGQDLVNTRAQESGGGKAPAGYRYLPSGDMEAIPGGPADLKAQATAGLKATGAADVESAIASLRSAYDRLESGGGITSTNKGALSNAAAAAGSSGLGQMIGKTIGTQNQSARNDIAMTRPALLAALMKATGMSAKQMDSNTELKLWMTTATDPTLDVESNRRALDSIERKYLGQNSQTKPSASAMPDMSAIEAEIARRRGGK